MEDLELNPNDNENNDQGQEDFDDAFKEWMENKKAAQDNAFKAEGKDQSKATEETPKPISVENYFLALDNLDDNEIEDNETAYDVNEILVQSVKNTASKNRVKKSGLKYLNQNSTGT